MAKTTKTEKDPIAAFELLPVPRGQNVSVIRLKPPPKSKRGKRRTGKMTEADWDKFEKDIEDAFEQVP
jgi:hypothetical protein